MAEFLTTRGISSELEKIINYSKQELTLISPYFQISDLFYNRLLEASEREINITIVFGKKRLKYEQFKEFAELQNIELLYYHDLHAKCFFNENDMVIGSMNMYAASEKNKEMGIHINNVDDHDLFSKAYQEANVIIKGSELVVSNRRYSNHTNGQDISNLDSGYCIRCNATIELNPNHPYCENCFSIWNEFQNPDYQENICHSCGSSGPSTMRKPLCYSCFSN